MIELLLDLKLCTFLVGALSILLGYWLAKENCNKKSSLEHH